MRNNNIIAILFFSLLSQVIWAQANDECAGAQVISDPTDFCSPTPGEDTQNATPSPDGFPSCFSNVQSDLWYTFTAVAPDVIIIVKGSTPTNPTGTMFGPQVALYSGTCGNLTEIACAADLNFSNNLPLLANNLVPGQQYFIRIDAVIPGSFQYCIKNQQALNTVSGDCPTGTIICSKDPIEVGPVFNAGNDNTEMDDAPCLGGFLGSETTSAWFVFTAANDGKLEFTLTPNDPLDDLDFVVYRLPNGPGDCTDKVSERCMAAGDFTPTSPCMGPTGLNSTATDINQPPGCAPGMDNFLRFLTLQQGATYALVVNNFTSIGNGFRIDWGGTALFKGSAVTSISADDADLKICVGQEITFSDTSSTANGTIEKWHWDFGDGATPDTSNLAGPVTVQYATTGPKMVVLTVETNEGCAALDTIFLFVQVCCTLDVTDVNVAPGCPDSPTATATVAVDNALAPLTVSWSNGQTADSLSTTFATTGNYSVLVVDANGCRDSIDFLVETPKDVDVTFPQDTSILQGESIQLGVNATPSDSLSVSWTAPGQSPITGTPASFSPQETTTYFVEANNTGCAFTDSVTIVVRKPKFDVPNAFTPNGDGFNDGFGAVNVGHTFVRLEVWSRWGEKVFDSELEGSERWNGTINGEPAPSDVYAYRVQFLNPDGTPGVKQGDITLLR